MKEIKEWWTGLSVPDRVWEIWFFLTIIATVFIAAYDVLTGGLE